ncbi:hypothetical protein APX70_06978, partial [Pseudomonas syringae pv. maculicola]
MNFQSRLRQPRNSATVPAHNMHWTYRTMNSRKTLAIALTAWISIQVTPDGFANERNGYGPNTVVLSTVAS